MAEEFQTGVCGGSLFRSFRSAFGSSPCSSAINDMGSCFGWPSSDLISAKAIITSSPESDSLVVDSLSGGGGGSSNMSMDSTLQMMGIGLSSSSPTDWSDTLIGRTESNFSEIQQEDLNSSFNNYQQQAAAAGFKPMNQELLMLPTSFPMNSNSVPNCINYRSDFLQTLFESNPEPQQSLYGEESLNLDEFSMNKPSSILQKQKHFWNNNASASAINDIQTSLLPSQSQFLVSSLGERINCPKINPKQNKHNEEARDQSNMAKRSNNISNESSFKRPRFETPSPLPTFKVRKEKLGDRITALQQLVSPFGKTDTASVLHEAIEYIKFLHDQVNVLSTPYMKNAATPQCQQTPDKLEETEGPNLKGRGLCLVPISSTFPVAAETTSDFWAPSFGGAFR